MKLEWKSSVWRIFYASETRAFVVVKLKLLTNIICFWNIMVCQIFCASETRALIELFCASEIQVFVKYSSFNRFFSASETWASVENFALLKIAFLSNILFLKLELFVVVKIEHLPNILFRYWFMLLNSR